MTVAPSKLPFGLAAWLAWEREHPPDRPVTHRCEVCGRGYHRLPRTRNPGGHCPDGRCPGGRVVPVAPEGP